MNIKRLMFLLLTFISVVLSSSIDREMFECVPSEPFLSVFLKIYDMHWKLLEHEERVHQVLGQFETDPSLLFNDETSFPIVVDQIISGFGFGILYFYRRSFRLLTKILMTRPGNGVILKILEKAGPHERTEIIEIMIRSGYMPHISEALRLRSITSKSFESILMNKLRSSD